MLLNSHPAPVRYAPLSPQNAEYKKSSENDLITEGVQRSDRKTRMRKKTSGGVATSSGQVVFRVYNDR